jgi:hypothetical protein
MIFDLVDAFSATFVVGGVFLVVTLSQLHAFLWVQCGCLACPLVRVTMYINCLPTGHEYHPRPVGLDNRLATKDTFCFSPGFNKLG